MKWNGLMGKFTAISMGNPHAVMFVENVENGTIKPIKAEQLFINILALNIFPFIASPLLKGFLDINNDNYKQLMEERGDTLVKLYIKNKVFLRRSFKYFTRDLNSEYYITHIVLQTLSDNLTLSFSLSVPTVFYESRLDYFENLFSGIYFLEDTEKLNEFIENHK